MARIKHDNNDDNKDISKYTDLGEMHWREALERAYSPGIDTVAVCPEMMPLRGTKRLIPRHKTRDKVMVVYDREYVFYRLYNLFIKKLDIVVNGRLDEKRYQTIIDGIREYSLKEFQRQRDQRIKNEASLLDVKFPGKGLQHWIKVLSDDVKEDKKENDTTKAGDETTLDTDENMATAVVIDEVAGATQTQNISDETTTTINDVEIHSSQALQADIDATDVATDENKEEIMVTMDDYDPDVEEDISGEEVVVEERRKRGRPQKQG